MMKRVALSAFAVLGVAGMAAAAPIALPTGEPIYGQFNNMEQFSATGSTLGPPGYAPAALTCSPAHPCADWGVLNISTLQHGSVTSPHTDIGGGTPFFVDGGVGGNQVTGIFWGFQLLNPTEATGGFLDLYWHDAGTIDNSCLSGTTCLPDASTVLRFGSGTFLARLNFASGIDPLNPLVTQKSDIDPSTPGGSGHSDGFLNVDTSMPGAWTDALAGGWFDTAFGPRDLRFSDFFNVDLTTWFGPGIAGLRSNDPVRDFTSSPAIPEPATLTLLGLGLASLGYRRKKKA